MYLKQQENISFKSGRLVSFFNKRKWLRRFIIFSSIISFVLILLAGGIYIGMKFNEGRGYSPEVLSNKILGRFNSPSFSKGIEALGTDIKTANINIKHTDWLKLSFDQQNALKGDKNFEYVKANIDYDGKSFPIKMRLKGDRKIHWEDPEQMSFRVIVKGDNTFMNMKKFSLQKPRAKNYIYEWLYHKALEREDILSLRYYFINLSLNGKDIGTYAIEEHFEKRLVENRKFREGPILRMVEGPNNFFTTAPIVPYDEEKWSVPDKIEILNLGVSKFNAWRNGEIKTSEAFDSKKLARFFALSDLLGAEHGAIWKSVKFYFNPVTSKLEPIGCDAQLRFGYTSISSEMGLRPDIGYVHDVYEEYYNHLFVNEKTFDSVFYQNYITELERFSKATYTQKLFSDIDPELQTNLARIYKDFPLYTDYINHYGPDFYRFDKNVFSSKQGYIKEKLHPTSGISAFYDGEDENNVYLKIGNKTTMPIELINGLFCDSINFELNNKPKIKAKHKLAKMSFVRVSVNKANLIFWKDSLRNNLKVRYRVIGTEPKSIATVYGWRQDESQYFNSLLNDDARFIPNSFTVNDSLQYIELSAGEHVFNKSVVTPRGYKTIIHAGAKIDLINGANFIVKGPLIVDGTEDAEVLFQSSDSSGNGLLILNAKQKSSVNHAIFHNLSYPKDLNWKVSGAVNFYESEVSISNSSFLHNRCEDGLNIIRGKFTLSESFFAGSQSDAFDGDFCEGTITGCHFSNIGNDAIDVSGSVLTVTDVVMDSIGDKGVSAGEGSHIIAKSITILNSEIAVASKDDSQVDIEFLNIKNCKLGFTCFQKKPEYGSASIIVTKYQKSNIELDYLNEKRSTLNVNGKEIDPTNLKVEDVLYGIEFGKKTVR